MLSPVSAWPHRDALPALDMTPWSAFGIVFDCSGREGFFSVDSIRMFVSRFSFGNRDAVSFLPVW